MQEGGQGRAPAGDLESGVRDHQGEAVSRLQLPDRSQEPVCQAEIADIVKSPDGVERAGGFRQCGKPACAYMRLEEGDTYLCEDCERLVKACQAEGIIPKVD